jgi:hypothetical protein
MLLCINNSYNNNYMLASFLIHDVGFCLSTIGIRRINSVYRLTIRKMPELNSLTSKDMNAVLFQVNIAYSQPVNEAFSCTAVIYLFSRRYYI